MKASILQENLIKALSLTERFVSTKAQLPVLSNILLTANDKGFFIVATNLETGVRFRTGAKIEKKGSITVPAKIFTEFVNSLPSDTVNLSYESEELRVSCGSNKATFQVIDAQEYPAFPKQEGGRDSRVSFAMMDLIVRKVGFAASTDDSRPVLTGLLWDLSESQAKLAATDGYRLSLLKVDAKELGGEGVKILLPSSVLRDVVKVFSGESGDLNFSWSDEQKQVFFSNENTEVVTRVLDGEFPNYEAVIPKEEGIEITLNKRDLVSAVKMAAIFARDSANIVKWKVSGGSLEISANSPQIGKNVSKVSFEGDASGDREIAFNSRYLVDLLSHIDTDEVVFSMSESLRPGVFYEKGKEDSFLHVIMPVRVQE